jgi:acyl-CoA synthetase (AMP-forming)/AMP-acid ligase II
VKLVEQATHKLGTIRILANAGVIAPSRPDRLVKAGLALRNFGPTLAGGAVAAAARHPEHTAVIDEMGTLTWGQVDERSNALAHALAEQGLKTGDGVAIMCRNHRGFIDSTIACMKLGLTGLYLNTAFSGPQIRDVCEREEPKAIIYDHEFAGLVEDAAKDRLRFVAWHADGEEGTSHETLGRLIEGGSPKALKPPSQQGRIVILTSGTTGTPKGAQRGQPKSIDPMAALLERIPLKAGEPTMIAAPMFHSWGMVHFALGLSLASTYVLRRKFDPEATLELIAKHRATALAVVPVMLQRMLELDREVVDRHDTSSLRVIAASGSALPGELATKVMDRFGDVLYNLYGSTEVAWATIATPADLRAAPGTAGKPPRGTVVRIVDEHGKDLPQGETGRIFVGSEMAFEGYTGGGSKDKLDNLLSSGDVGHFDDGGRLFIDGRDDEMIVSGGENVFPREVEDLLSDHDDVADVAVIGVDDEKFGQRLKAFVVPCDGSDPSEDALKRHVKENLAGYKVPREIVFLDELPRNATGKVLKRELAER